MEMDAYTIIGHLKEMLQEKARIERFSTIKALLSCKLTVGSSVTLYVLKMKGHLKDLERLKVILKIWKGLVLRLSKIY